MSCCRRHAEGTVGACCYSFPIGASKATDSCGTRVERDGRSCEEPGSGESPWWVFRQSNPHFLGFVLTPSTAREGSPNPSSTPEHCPVTSPDTEGASCSRELSRGPVSIQEEALVEETSHEKKSLKSHHCNSFCSSLFPSPRNSSGIYLFLS